MRDFSHLTAAGLAATINKLQSKADHARKCGRIKRAKELTDDLIAARIERMRRGAKRRQAA